MNQADLVLEGGGVKGIGLVGATSALEDAGYSFRRVAGTSAGAIVGSLLAAGMPSARARELMGTLDLRTFSDPGLLDRFGPLGKGLSLWFEKGIYEGDVLRRWLGERLGELGVHTFADLRITDDADTALPVERRYKLVVMVTDISRGHLVRLPWDYDDYGLVADDQPVADAVRASMSIPFFYEPVTMRFGGSVSYLVDGGVLSNFPVDAFDRRDRSPRWPTFGIKLSAMPTGDQPPAVIRNTFDFAKAILDALLGREEQMQLDDPCLVDRTIFVDTFGTKATDFDIDPVTQQRLFDSGFEAAQRFLQRFDFEDHVARCHRGGPGG